MELTWARWCELQTEDTLDIPKLFLELPEMDSEGSFSHELNQQCIQEITHTRGLSM